ncbi:substrate-binding periplasmic protein [Saccharospirillum impatiens]|uniref:substrate-binding periplasmic protein n=1 Tax=Saccharospirillum impatiens TaxID=169438 RepID=UPI00068514BB|nr:ABC transporter substrate-binding protein [Saccharospirillum impatiens]
MTHYFLRLCQLTALLSLTACALVQASPLVVVGVPEPPFKMMEEGEITGIDVRIMQRVLEELNIAHEFYLLGSGSRMMREAEAGHIDVMMSLSHNPEREEHLSYPDRSYKDLSWHFIIRSSDAGNIEYSTLEDLQPWRVGAVQSWAYTREFWDMPLNRILVTDHRLLIDMVLSGRIDVAPVSTAETAYMIRLRNLENRVTFLEKPLTARPYYNVFVKNSEHPDFPTLVAEYDRVIEELQATGFIDRVYWDYLDTLDSLPYTANPGSSAK